MCTGARLRAHAQDLIAVCIDMRALLGRVAGVVGETRFAHAMQEKLHTLMSPAPAGVPVCGWPRDQCPGLRTRRPRAPAVPRAFLLLVYLMLLPWLLLRRGLRAKTQAASVGLHLWPLFQVFL